MAVILGGPESPPLGEKALRKILKKLQRDGVVYPEESREVLSSGDDLLRVQ
jgi:hypothetical protein